jgi:hypothetical protein
VNRGARAFWARQDAARDKRAYAQDPTSDPLYRAREAACRGLTPEEIVRRGLIPPEAGPGPEGDGVDNETPWGVTPCP